MNVEFSKSFDKQTSRIKDKTLLKRIVNVIKKVMESKSLSEIPNIKPIVGHPGYYRILLENTDLDYHLKEKRFGFISSEKEMIQRIKKFLKKLKIIISLH